VIQRTYNVSLLARSSLFTLVTSVIIGLMAIFYMGIGLRGFVKKKPFLISSRWLLAAITLAFLPVILRPLLMYSSMFNGGLNLMMWTNPLMFLFLLAIFWFQLKGYSAYGITENSFRGALHSALKTLNIPFEETLSSVKLPSYAAELKVNINGGMGMAKIQMKHCSDAGLLSKIVGEMNLYFDRTDVETNKIAWLFHVIMAIFMALLFLELSSLIFRF
jgi:hypothetical protein